MGQQDWFTASQSVTAASAGNPKEQQEETNAIESVAERHCLSVRRHSISARSPAARTFVSGQDLFAEPDRLGSDFDVLVFGDELD